ncbi:GGDEF domain-containing response regulator [Undibacterium sp. TS12]|uniref:putative bifunctional diguanylate cyclase/phosphodiesterase n=1 Tax=Undibacterium sp. TS12 TaxID=2908202 RepID=UPI001F4D262C|nr:GGDEF domain-containing response regulator [Undibacterium sp. TS12]MCH8622201.1 EAL domain-containing protein [Undibacterium sp. TS12]
MISIAALPTTTLRILIIDDDELDRRSVIRAMKQVSVSVSIVEANNALDGLLLAKETQYDVILLDYRLPDRDGIEVLKSLRLDKTHTAIIMLTNQEDISLAEQAIEAGAQDFLLKEEVNARRLMRALHQARHRHKLETELSRSYNQLRELAEHDALTGLANRYDFERALAFAVSRAKRESLHGKMAVLLLDLDRFKNVNDTYGHAIGDQLLIKVARRLGTTTRGSDLLARLGGDEFVVLVQDMEKVDQAILLAKRIVDAFKKPIVLDGMEWHVTMSIGIAVFGSCANDATELMKCADIAMYRAKQEGRNQSHFYSDQLHQAVRHRLYLERDLRHALRNEQLKVFYQAKINAVDGTLGGVEALLRWQHPVEGILTPGVFLPMAEEMGLMFEIDQWMMRTACTQLEEWRALPFFKTDELTVAVNVSAIQLQGDNLIYTVDEALLSSGLPPHYLELEITENALIRDPNHVAGILHKLAARGVKLSLDDFGTGYSSFGHLKMLPIQVLKIDQSFVTGVGKGESQERLLAAMIAFAQTMELSLVVEGIETAEQARFCADLGCELLQGYYYSQAISSSEFEDRFLTGAIHHGTSGQ